MKEDTIYLDKAIELASHGIDSGGGPFGAVIVRDNEIVAQSYNKVVLLKDPTAHAEILAIREASHSLGTFDLSGCILYTSCEPCPMCFGAIYWSGIKRVVYACDRNDAANAGFNDRLIYSELCMDVQDRKVIFNRKTMLRANEVFGKWLNTESKIGY